MALLALGFALLLSSCGRAEEALEPRNPSLATSASATPQPSASSEPAAAQPTPDGALSAPDAMPAYPFTSAPLDRSDGGSTATAEAQLALTPEPTTLPARDGPRLRDLWPATAQQSDPPSRLYLRRYSNDRDTPDTFWEVSLPDGQFRRLPAVEQDSIDQSAQISPDGRYLAYVTGVEMERTLRVLDLAQGTDRVLAKYVTSSIPRCSQAFAWSPNGRDLAVITLRDGESGPLSLLQLYNDVSANSAPQTLVELSSFLDLFGWLDANRLLVSHWDTSIHPSQLLSVDRQGRIITLAERRPERLECASLSFDGRELIYNEFNQVKRLNLITGQQESIPLTPAELRTGQKDRHPVLPNELFWIGDSRIVLISRQDTQRRVWLRSLDQIEDQPGIFLSPPYQASYRFGVIDVSPDGHFLVACEQPPRDDPRVRIDETRTWLYSIPDDRWTLLSTKAGVNCDIVIGWANAGEAQ